MRNKVLWCRGDGDEGGGVRRLLVVDDCEMVFMVMAVVLWWWRGGRGCGGDVAAGVMMLSGSMMGCGVGWRGGGGEWGELAGGRPKSRRKMGDGVEKLEREERKICVCVTSYK
ncbi:hypothetical protein Tco_1455797 [Tanacetum coccineum]